MARKAYRKVELGGAFSAVRSFDATDLSGIASATPLGQRRLKCLVIDNESLAAQFATYDTEDRELTPGAVVPLLPGDRDAIEAFGTPQRLHNGEKEDEYILDGEAVAWLAPHYYVTGSHSIHDTDENGEGKGGARVARFRRSAHLVARVRRDGREPELTWRLNEALSSLLLLKPYFRESPEKRGGINIEGLAARGSRLYFGFRTPIVEGHALMLRVRARALFSKSEPLEPELIEVPLGNRGIRDLATLPDGRFLILAGPPEDGGAGFSFNVFDRADRTVRQLSQLEKDGGEKPEGMLLATYEPRADGSADAGVLVLRDGPEDGRPRLYDLKIPPRRP